MVVREEGGGHNNEWCFFLFGSESGHRPGVGGLGCGAHANRVRDGSGRTAPDVKGRGAEVWVGGVGRLHRGAGGVLTAVGVAGRVGLPCPCPRPRVELFGLNGEGGRQPFALLLLDPSQSHPPMFSLLHLLRGCPIHRVMHAKHVDGEFLSCRGFREKPN